MLLRPRRQGKNAATATRTTIVHGDSGEGASRSETSFRPQLACGESRCQMITQFFEVFGERVRRH
jgi:hypothetical protein